jgi:hypothetical protein
MKEIIIFYHPLWGKLLVNRLHDFQGREPFSLPDVVDGQLFEPKSSMQKMPVLG